MSVMEDIRSRLDIVQYVGRTVTLKRAGRTFKACCPFHHEKTPSFVVDPDRQSWRCFGACATGGDLFGYVMRQQGLTFREALETLAKEAGVEVRQRTPEQRRRDDNQDRLRGVAQTAADFYHARLFDPRDAEAAAALAYARDQRGFTDETLRAFGFGYAPNAWDTLTHHLLNFGYSEQDLLDTGLAKRSDKDASRIYDVFRHRLLLPIRDGRGRVVGFGGRALDPNEPAKYLNSPQNVLFDKSRLLFALDRAAPAIRADETAVIVEGYMDAVQAHQAGYTNVVAQMGTALTESQLSLIAPRWAKTILLSLDADAAGQNATRRSIEVIREALTADYGGRLGIDLRVLTVPNGKDPDDFIRETPAAWPDLVAKAVSAADYLIAMEVGALPPDSSLHAREAVARRLLPILTATEDNLYRQENVQRLALKLRIAERDLLAWAAQETARTKNEARSRLASSRPATPRPVDARDPFDAVGRDEPPPTDFDDDGYLDVGQDDVWESALDVAVAPPPPPHAILEKRCLRLLLQRPKLFYEVNRKFRELAGDDELLAVTAFGSLCGADFAHDTYRAVLLLLEEALTQIDFDEQTYLRESIAPMLMADFQILMRDEWEDLRPSLTILMADLPASIDQREQHAGDIDLQAALIHEALRLRRLRVETDLTESAFLLREAHESGDMEGAAERLGRIALLTRARRLIDAESSRQALYAH